MNQKQIMKRETAFDHIEQLSLGELIQEIEKYGTKKEDGEQKTISFDFGSAIPTDLGSWRGDYSELEIGYALTGYDGAKHFDESKADDFLQILKSALGKYFTGWKGGEFKMGENTPIWVSAAGNGSHTAVVGVRDLGYELIILTAHCEY